MKRFFLMMTLTMMLLSAGGCGGAHSSAPQPPAKGSYRHVSPEEAQKIMNTETGYIILDVRTPKEYETGHIPRAICIPNETIDKTPPALLPDKQQLILVYCRSGQRSAAAAKKLADMGYTNVVDFGGLIDWHGELTTNDP